MVCCYTCRTPVLTQPFTRLSFVYWNNMLIASQSPRVTLHHGSVNFILHGSCALGDGFHLN